jgi:hypothetical protein
VLKSHLQAVERKLVAESLVAANAGHSLHKGTPREVFIREFLNGHLSERIAVGTGEIIDAGSRPGESRPQNDIVLYKRDYPRIRFGGEVSGFLVESVVATIEVKSSLTKEELKQAVGTARKVKALKPNLVVCSTSGYNPPGPLAFVVAYDGPASMRTVHGWMPDIRAEFGISYPPMPPVLNHRLRIPSPSVDGVVVLGRGFLQFDNSPYDFLHDSYRLAHPEMRWQGADVEAGSLLMLFMWLTATACNSSEMWLDPRHYLQTFRLEPGTFWGLP